MGKIIQLYRNAVLFTTEADAVAKLKDDNFKAGMVDGMTAATRYKEGENPVKTVFAIYHRDKETNVVTETIFNPENVPQKVLDKFQQISINGHKLFGDDVTEEGVVVLDGSDLNVGGTGDHKNDTIADAIEALYSSLSGLDINEDITTSGARKETVSLAGVSKSFQIPSIVKSNTTTSGSSATYKMVDYDGNQIGENIEMPADRIFVSAQIGDNADTFNEITGVITPAETPSGVEVLHMVFVKADGAFEDAKLSLEHIVFEVEAGDGLDVNTESGHILSVKIDETSEEYLSVSENGVKIAGLDDTFHVIASSLNDLNDRIDAVDVNISSKDEGYLSKEDDGLAVTGLDKRFEVIAAALNDLNERVDEASVEISDDSEDFLSKDDNGKLMVSGLDEKFEVIATSLNDLNVRINDVSVDVSSKDEGYLSKEDDGLAVTGLDDKFEVISSALNDLNDRLSNFVGMDKEIKVINGDGSSKIIGFADDAVYDCGEF